MRAKSFPIDKAYENLAHAIIESAVNDYRKALNGITYDRRRSIDFVIEAVETFFRSDYFKVLTKVEGEYIINRLRAEHENERSSYESNVNTSNT